MAKFTAKDFVKLPKIESCRLIDFKEAEVKTVPTPERYILIVKGIKPCINIEVHLSPRLYIIQPDYWGIEVVGCLPGGICLPAVAPYVVTILLHSTIGTKGIEVIGANGHKKIDIPSKKK